MDWGTVPTWISAVATAAGFGWTVALAWRALNRDRSKLANSVICYFVGDVVVVRNFSDSLVTEVVVETEDAGGARSDVVLEPNFLAPLEERRVESPVPPSPTVSLMYEYQDVRGDRWERRWGQSARRAKRHLR